MTRPEWFPASVQNSAAPGPKSLPKPDACGDSRAHEDRGVIATPEAQDRMCHQIGGEEERQDFDEDADTRARLHSSHVPRAEHAMRSVGRLGLLVPLRAVARAFFVYATAGRQTVWLARAASCYSPTNDPSGARMKPSSANGLPPASFQMPTRTRKSPAAFAGLSQNTSTSPLSRNRPSSTGTS
jgi:hypothetical protein